MPKSVINKYFKYLISRLKHKFLIPRILIAKLAFINNINIIIINFQYFILNTQIDKKKD